MTVRRVAAAAVVLGLLLVGCAGGDADGRAVPSSAAPSDAVEEQPTAVDVGFAQDMATHHDQALLMAQLAVTRGSAAVRSIGLAILTAQAQENGALRGWLRLWDEPVVAPRPMAWTGHAMASGAPMPGMATPEELFSLTRASGTRFDVRFLQLMTRHHRGGIDMAKAALDGDSSDVVREAARQMVAEQVEDLGALRALLAADGGRELPYTPHAS